ncbi:MAG: hypothetical protein AAF843_19840, partial [Bacteroidota bacterium]
MFLTLIILSSYSSFSQTIDIITPVDAGKASTHGFYPMERAFDSQPTWDVVQGEPLGGQGGNDAPAYTNRTGYVDFGPNYASLRITETWTLYKSWTTGNQIPYAELWWDDDKDQTNDNGVVENSLNFNSAQGVINSSSETWIKDGDFTLNPIIPQRRYLIFKSAASITNKAKEFAFVGFTALAIDPPTNLNVAISTTSALLTWNDSGNDENAYVVERLDESNSNFVSVQSLLANVLTHTDTDLIPGKTYRYRVGAVSLQNDTVYSQEVVVNTPLSTETDLLINNQPSLASNYSADQDNGTFQIIDNQNTILLEGNAWKSASYNYTVTANTVLEFDFKSTDEGEIQGIGFDNDNLHAQDKIFQLYGTQTWGITDYKDYQGTDWKHYIIPVGNHFTGVMDRITFIGDEDKNGASQNGFFRNVLVYEQSITPFDSPNSAFEIVSTDNWCSNPSEFTTAGMSGVGPSSSCNSISPESNVWFTFIANSNELSIELSGTISRASMTLRDSNLNSVVCNIDRDYGEIAISTISLIPGNQYYISVDNRLDNAVYKGTFGLCLNEQASYDFKEGAVELNHGNNWCSGNDEYTTSGMTADGVPSSCNSISPQSNVWFTFIATSGEIDIALNGSGISRASMTLWDNNSNEINCSIDYNYGEISLGSTSLVPGNRYYISVDNRLENQVYKGNFGLCITDKASYDYKAGALEIPHYSNWCSEHLEFSTKGKTGDGPSSSCNSISPESNVWFKFIANSNEVNLSLSGTISRANMTLWDENMMELSCKIDQNYGQISLTSEELITGSRYYVSVDNRFDNQVYKGAFSLCISSGDHNLTWRDLNGVSLTSENGLIKTSSNTGWDAGAASYNRLGSGEDGWLEFVIPEDHFGSYILGFSSNNTDDHFNSQSYSIRVFLNGDVRVYEASLARGLTYTSQPGSRIRIERVGDKINYWLDDTQIRSIDAPNTTSLIVDVSANNSNTVVPNVITSFDQVLSLNVDLQPEETGSDGAISLTVSGGDAPYTYSWSTGATTSSINNLSSGTYDVTISDALGRTLTRSYSVNNQVTWTDLVNVALTADNGLEKTSSNLGWDAGAASYDRLASGEDGWLEFIIPEDHFGSYVLGFSSNNADNHYNSQSYSIRVFLNGDVRVYEASLARGLTYTSQPGSRVRIERVGGKVNYWLDDTQIRSIDVQNTTELIIDVSANNSNTVVPNVITSFDYEPNIPASNLTFTEVTENSMRLNWTNGDGDGRILMLREGQSLTVTGSPDDGVEYTWSSNVKTAPGKGPNKIIYAGSDSSILVTGLKFNTLYGFRLFEYNGSAEQIDYLLSPTANGANYTLGAAPEPTVGPSLLRVDSITDNSAHISWVLGNGERSLVRVRERGVLTVNGRPKDGKEYEFSTYFPSSTRLIASVGVVYKGVGSAFKLTGLEPDTRYSIGVFDFNGVDSTTNYLYSSPQITFYTTNGSVDDNLELQALRDLYESTNGDNWTSQTDADPNNDWPRTATEWTAINSVDQVADWYGVIVDSGDVHEIQLKNNGLAGVFPESVTRLTTLKKLYLGEYQTTNQLTGPIPESIANLSNIEYLVLAGNQLSGEIPEVIFNNQNLIYASLGHNGFTGSIPGNIGSAINLTHLSFENNNLTGSIPGSIGELKKLVHFAAGYQNITGSIPT